MARLRQSMVSLFSVKLFQYSIFIVFIFFSSTRLHIFNDQSDSSNNSTAGNIASPPFSSSHLLPSFGSASSASPVVESSSVLPGFQLSGWLSPSASTYAADHSGRHRYCRQRHPCRCQPLRYRFRGMGAPLEVDKISDGPFPGSSGSSVLRFMNSHDPHDTIVRDRLPREAPRIWNES